MAEKEEEEAEQPASSQEGNLSPGRPAPWVRFEDGGIKRGGKIKAKFIGFRQVWPSRIAQWRKYQQWLEEDTLPPGSVFASKVAASSHAASSQAASRQGSEAASGQRSGFQPRERLPIVRFEPPAKLRRTTPIGAKPAEDKNDDQSDDGGKRQGGLGAKSGGGDAGWEDRVGGWRTGWREGWKTGMNSGEEDWFNAAREFTADLFRPLGLGLELGLALGLELSKRVVGRRSEGELTPPPRRSGPLQTGSKSDTAVTSARPAPSQGIYPSTDHLTSFEAIVWAQVGG